MLREIGFILGIGISFLVFGIVYAYIKITDRQKPFQVSIEIPLSARETDATTLPSNKEVSYEQ